MNEMTLGTGEILYHKGDLDDRVFIVYKGEM